MRTVVISLLLALSSSVGSACTMDQPSSAFANCRVTGEEFLSKDTGGAEVLCASILEARSGVHQTLASVDVRIISPYLMVATQKLADGTTLPEVRTGRSDRPLGRRSVRMLADALAAQLAAVKS